jgi:two-component system chemotaxis sensor kinase CheA
MTDVIDPATLELARGETNDCLERIERNLLALESGSAAPDALEEMFRDAHSIKGTAGMVGWSAAASIAHGVEDRLAQCRDQGEFQPELAEPLLASVDSLRKAINGEAGSPAPPPTREDLGSNGLPENGGAAIAEPTAATLTQPSIRVAAHKVDRMMDAVGETVLHHRRLEHLLGADSVAAEETTEEELDMGERMLGELQDSVVEMRTLPLSTITTPFPRAVRDLAASEGKEVELVITGDKTQLDRTILDGISETITHLLRNTVAHGIEPPSEREQAGKPRLGRLELRAEQRGSMVAIEVKDDGRGVAAELLARAGDEGSLTELLSAPGFSTAAEVSDVAGRGVGLDAVKARVESLGGSLEVRSETGRGTEVIMLLPVTLALLRVLLCRRDGQAFGVPLASVREVVTVTEPLMLGGRRSLELRGESIPLGDLATMLGNAGSELPPTAPAVILSSPSRPVAVACDEVLGDQEAIVKGLGPLLAGVPGYLGATILDDGSVVLILDPNHLLKMPSGTSAPAAASNGSAQRIAPQVLVVDDQFSVRELQRSILETAGYRVETATSGVDALERLGAATDVDLVVTDLDMPGMGGFELLRTIRHDPEHASLPVVIITSNKGDDDRRRGVEEGADAYIVKDEFDQRTLLGTIEHLLGR